MKIYFDRNIPLYLTRYETFDGIEVEADLATVKAVEKIRDLIDDVQKKTFDVGSPERANQELADFFVNGMASIIKRKQ